jgi:hypothetical protein
MNKPQKLAYTVSVLILLKYIHLVHWNCTPLLVQCDWCHFRHEKILKCRRARVHQAHIIALPGGSMGYEWVILMGYQWDINGILMGY